MSGDRKVLNEIVSMHELRETGGEFVKIEEGVFIEVIDFNPINESVVIHERWKVIGMDKVDGSVLGNPDYERYYIKCWKMDIDKELAEKKKVASAVVDKHCDVLKASFAKCLVEGISNKSMMSLESMAFKLRCDLNVLDKKR